MHRNLLQIRAERTRQEFIDFVDSRVTYDRLTYLTNGTLHSQLGGYYTRTKPQGIAPTTIVVARHIGTRDNEQSYAEHALRIATPFAVISSAGVVTREDAVTRISLEGEDFTFQTSDSECIDSFNPLQRLLYVQNHLARISMLDLPIELVPVTPN